MTIYTSIIYFLNNKVEIEAVEYFFFLFYVFPNDKFYSKVNFCFVYVQRRDLLFHTIERSLSKAVDNAEGTWLRRSSRNHRGVALSFYYSAARRIPTKPLMYSSACRWRYGRSIAILFIFISGVKAFWNILILTRVHIYIFFFTKIILGCVQIILEVFSSK